MYFGSQTSYSGRMKDDDKQAIKVFDTLLPVIGTGYHVFFDRWYTSLIDLIDWMTDHQMYFTGTVNVNCVGFPSGFKTSGKMPRCHTGCHSTGQPLRENTLGLPFGTKKLRNLFSW